LCGFDVCRKGICGKEADKIECGPGPVSQKVLSAFFLSLVPMQQALMSCLSFESSNIVSCKKDGDAV